MIYHLKKYFVIAISIIMLSASGIFIFSQLAQAQGPHGPGKAPAPSIAGAPAHTPHQAPSRAVNSAPTPHQKKYVDSRYRHNRSYPPRGYSVKALPADHRVVTHGHSRYYSSHGVWYSHNHGRYVVVAPPIGLFIPFLPFAYTTIWFHGIPYYYANETYYTQTPGGYVVAEPPQVEMTETPPETGNDEYFADDKMFIYPRNGQSAEQQDVDRYECHQWASEQTNYDPTKIPPEMPAEKIMQQRSDYQRAMAACLDGRGYTAK
jgi:hypothetical protein